jgi:hypothetical protein
LADKEVEVELLLAMMVVLLKKDMVMEEEEELLEVKMVKVVEVQMAVPEALK